MAQPTHREAGHRADPGRRLRKAARAVFAALCLILSLAVVAAVVTRRPIGTDEWQWPYHEVVAGAWSVAPAAAVAGLMVLLALGAFWTGVNRRFEEISTVAVMTVLSVVLQFASGLMSPSGLADSALVNARPWSGGYYLESLLIGRYDWSETEASRFIEDHLEDMRGQ